jgi:hypothetical protein
MVASFDAIRPQSRQVPLVWQELELHLGDGAMSFEARDDIPSHYRTLLKDWLRIEVPPHLNAHAVATKCNIPIGSYYVTSGAMLIEMQGYFDAVNALLAAEAIGFHSPPAAERNEPPPIESASIQSELTEDEAAEGEPAELEMAEDEQRPGEPPRSNDGD